MSTRFAALFLAAPLFACAAARPAEPPADTEDAFEVIVLAHAPAVEVAKVLDRALSGRGGAEARVVADARTNSLIVMAGPEDLARVKDLIAALDRDVEAR